jgi:hypothetical protein
MFNNLSNAADQGRQAVDDIFAETDKAAEGGLPGANNTITNPSGAAASRADIETRHVGLTSNDEMMEEPVEKAGGGKWFKIVLILIVAAILILGGYLVYSKFLKVSPEINSNIPVPVVNNTPVENQTPAPAEVGSFVATTSGEATEASSVAPVVAVPEIPGVNAPAAGSTTATVTPTVVSTIDSDSDGLIDSEETILSTNVNVIDTDNDGLSDYEEVKIYRSNPLSADTDNDGFLDGKEVNSGYNPNGPGKLIAQ